MFFGSPDDLQYIIPEVAVHLLAQATREPAERARWTAAARVLCDRTDPPGNLDVELE